MVDVSLKEEGKKVSRSRKVVVRDNAKRSIDYNLILKLLTSDLDRKVRDRVLKRVKELCSKLDYELSVGGDDDLKIIFKNGWNCDMLKVVFVLNAFFLHVLFPLHLAVPPDRKNALKGVPIKCGGLIFDNQRRRSIDNMYCKFVGMCGRVPGGLVAVSSNTMKDIAYVMARHMGDI